MSLRPSRVSLRPSLALVLCLGACDLADKHRCITGGDCDPGRVCLDTVCVAPGSICATAGCALYSVAPQWAETGDTLSLEGTFGPDLMVQFPGGASAQPTAVEVHRATVTVPAGATAGDLFAVSDGKMLGPVPFRRTTFPLSVSATRARPEQLGYARRPPGVAQTADRCAISTGRYVYLIGDTIERARVEADGALSSFVADPVSTLEPRAGAACTMVGGTVVLAGPSDTAEQAAILADGTLGAFARFGTMSQARRGAAAAVVGGSLYVFGPDTSVESAPLHGGSGFSTAAPMVAPHSGAVATVTADAVYIAGESLERAAITNGAPGAFSTVSQLASPRSRAAGVRLGHYLYLFGGEDAQGNALDSFDRIDLTDLSDVASDGLAAPRTRAAAVLAGNFVHLLGGSLPGDDRLAIDDGAALGDFSPAVDLDEPRSNFSVAALGSWLYLIGGRDNGTPVADVLRAPVAADGTLGVFARLSNSLTTPRYGAALAVIDGSLYLLGGADGSGQPLASVEHADIGPDGDLGDFSLAPITIADGRAFAVPAVLGDSLDLLGGEDASGNLASIVAGPLADSLGALTLSPTDLVTAHRAASLLATGRALFLAGGVAATGTLSEVERAGYSGDGTLGTFTSQPMSGWLGQSRGGPGNVVVGGRWWLLGGAESASIATIESAPIGLDGELGAFTPAAAGLTTPRSAYRAIVLGNWVYALGGLDAAGTLATTERAPIIFKN